MSQPNPGQSPAIDFAYLAHQTGGDEMLEAELLDIFEAQMRGIVAALRDTADRLQRRDLAHKLCGSARALGAKGVGNAAEALEVALRQDRPPSLIIDLVDEVDQHAVWTGRAIAQFRAKA